MKVAVYYSNRDVRLAERPRPKIGPGELLVKIQASGVCGSDVLEWYRKKKAPLVLGHEIAGEIAEVGAGVKGWRAGQRVFAAHHVPCNACRYCLAGSHTACETLHTTNFDPGGFAEFVRLPALNVDRGVLELPGEVSFAEGSFVEPLGCVARGQRLAGLKRGQAVLILGSGISGILHVMLARALGAGPIIATDVSDYRLAAARRLGADLALDAGEDLPARVRGANGGFLADLVVVCTGAFSAFRQALQCAERGGAVLCFAATDPGVELPIPVNDFWRNEMRVLTSYGSAPGDSAEALELIRARRVPVAEMITHRLPLAQTGEGFRLVAAGGESLKVIIEPQR